MTERPFDQRRHAFYGARVTQRLSVLIPSYNAAAYLPASLDSMLAQVDDATEIVVVDDCSTDDTRDVLCPYEPRVRVVAGPGRGLSAARNAALAASSGEWIAFQDADDVAEPDRLRTLQAVLDAHPAADGVFSNGAHLNDRARTIVPAALAQRLDGNRLRPRDVFLGFPVYFQSALVARKAFERAGPFDDSLRVQPDLEYGYRLFEHGTIRFVNRITFHWRQHDSNMTNDRVRIREDVTQTLERILDEGGEIAEQIGRRQLKERLARHWFRLARIYEKQGARERAQQAASRAAALRPLHPRYQLLRWRLA